MGVATLPIMHLHPFVTKKKTDGLMMVQKTKKSSLQGFLPNIHRKRDNFFLIWTRKLSFMCYRVLTMTDLRKRSVKNLGIYVRYIRKKIEITTTLEITLMVQIIQIGSGTCHLILWSHSENISSAFIG